jgi:hypothetical protein
MIRRIPQITCYYCSVGIHELCKRYVYIRRCGIQIKVKCQCSVCGNSRLDDYYESEGEKVCC